MNGTSSTPTGTIHRLGGGLLLLLALVASVAAGLAAFAGTAAVSAAIPVLATVGLIVLAAATLLAQPGLRLLGFRQPWRAGLGVAALLFIVVSGLTLMTIFRPIPTTPAGAAPAGVKFWDLAMGSRVAYVEAPATGDREETPIVFLHGGPGTAGEGIPAIGKTLTGDGFDVYAYHQLGAGRSTRLDDVTGYTVAR